MKDSTRRAVRTAFQTLLAVAAAISRLMSTPAVENALPDWLRKDKEEAP
ncbi:hypothetical protein [Streptomyces olivochromogenes]|nr:hypothetical protein [Streptomyces olivochromogenes]MCF3133947.1 hypothetical protein [Streptomyces olivochromogenes]